jgi:heparanase
MPRVGTVGERLQSYNVEMAEVIGGTFWKPYGKDTAAIPGRQQPTTPGATPVGLDPALF